MASEKPCRGCFAPSPNGPLHFGSLLAAVGSWLMARQAQGQWLIRIEDIDPLREIKGAAQKHIEILKAFGMQSDETIVWQSQRNERYQEILQNLIDAGEAFECFCSRKDLISRHGVHRFCMTNNAEKHSAIRLKIPDTTIQFHDHNKADFRKFSAPTLAT